MGISCNCIGNDLFEEAYDDDDGDGEDDGAGICTVVRKNVQNGKQHFDSL